MCMYLCFCYGSNKRKVLYSNYLHFQSALITFCQFICLTSLLTRCQECIDSHITSTGLNFFVDKKKSRNSLSFWWKMLFIYVTCFICVEAQVYKCSTNDLHKISHMHTYLLLINYFVLWHKMTDLYIRLH